jgi:hypothetical protein
VLGEAERGLSREPFRKESRRCAPGWTKRRRAKALREGPRPQRRGARFEQDLADLERVAAARSNARPANRPLTGVSALAQQLRSDITRRLETFPARLPRSSSISR